MAPRASGDRLSGPDTESLRCHSLAQKRERPAGWASEAFVSVEGGGLVWGVRGWTFRVEMTNPPPLLNLVFHYAGRGGFVKRHFAGVLRVRVKHH